LYSRIYHSTSRCFAVLFASVSIQPVSIAVAASGHEGIRVKLDNVSNEADVPQKRGERIPPQGVGGYDQNWYPICLAADVPRAGMFGTEFMNGRVLVMRDRDGRAQVLSAYCRHLGADLTKGEIIDGQVRCPYHHWRYNAEGVCTVTGLGDSPPAGARLFKFPTHEAFGLVWAFNGEKALYDPPHFDIPESELEYRTELNQLVNCDHFIAYSNSSDIQHLRAVHQIELTVSPQDVRMSPHGMRYVQEMTIPGMGAMRQDVAVFGTNCVIFASQDKGRVVFNMSAGKALPGNRTLASLTSATRRSGGDPREDQLVQEALAAAIGFTRKLFEEDDPILNNVRFRQDLLSPHDRMLSVFINYVRNYPRSSIAADMIS
jgi:nitrite reductase/ring-hydroxylating ferredoxin subunit